MDCDRFPAALIEGDPAAPVHAQTCVGCARLLTVTAPASVPAGILRSLPSPALPRRRIAVVLAFAASLCLGVIGAQALRAPEAPPAPSLSDDPFADPFAEEDTLTSPTDLLSTAILHRSTP